MCGLVGVINREKYKFTSDKLIKYFNQALFTDTLRGRHGTGVSAVGPKGGITSYKKAMTAPDFLDLRFAQGIISNETNVFLSGHNRWATQGAHTDENSHPFKHKHITMFHNGTLDNHTDLPDGSNFDVDSDAIAHSLSKIGAVKTLESLEGAYALVWYDEDKECINFARNDERPLWFGYVENSSSAIYASEKEMLQWLASRNKLALSSIEELQVGKHIQVFLDEEKKTTITSFTPKVSDWGNYYNNYPYSNKSSTKTGIVISSGGLATTNLIDIDIKSFSKYKSSNSKYGILTGFCKKDKLSRAILFNGISEVDSVKFLGKTVTGIVSSLTSGSVQCRDIKLKKEVTTQLAIVKNKTVIEGSGVLIEGNRIGPNSRSILQSEFDSLTKHGCVVCSCNMVDEEDSLIHWDSQENPYCEECALELYV